MENAGAVFFRETLLLVDPETRHALGEEARRRGDLPRARAHVVRRPRHHGLVGRPLAERGLRHLDGLPRGRCLEARVEDVERLPAPPRGGARPRRAGRDASHLREGADAERGDAELRPDHLREGRIGGAHDRALPRRRDLPRWRAPLHPRTPGEQRRRGRSVERAGRGVGAGRRAGGARLDRAAGLPVAAPAPRRARRAQLAALRAAALPRTRPRARTARSGRCPGWAAWPRASARVSVRQLLTRRRGEIELPVRAPRFVYGNAEEGGFYRPLHDEVELAALAGALDALAPVERMGLVGHQWAAARAGQARVDAFLDLALSLRQGARPRRAGGAARPARGCARVRRAARSGAEAEAALRARVARVLRARLRRGRLGRRRRASATTTACAAPRCWRWWAKWAKRPPCWPRRASAAPPSSPIAARSSRTCRMRSSRWPRAAATRRSSSASSSAAREATTPQDQRRFLLGLGAFQEPKLVERALSLTLTDAVGTQDVALLLHAARSRTARRAQQPGPSGRSASRSCAAACRPCW